MRGLRNVAIVLSFLFLSSFVLAAPWALVLSGGGARGAYEAGVLKAIEELNLDVGGVYGTSTGALNGAFFVQGAVATLYKMWQNLSLSNVVMLPSNFSTNTSNFYFYAVQHLMTKNFSVKPLYNLIKKFLNENKIRKSDIDFGLVTFDLSNFAPVEIYISQIPKGALIDYLMASSNYPLFQRWTIEGNTYIDGGIYNNAPVNMALSKGFKKILLVDVSDIPIFLPHIPQGTTLKIVKPSGPLGNVMDFVPKKERLWEKMGYLDTMKAFGKFVGQNYYIYPFTKNLLIDKMLKMNHNELEKIAELIGANVENCTNDFAVYERIIPKILEMVPSTSFTSLNLSLMEITAKYLGINRLIAYTQESLCEAISKAILPPKNSSWFPFEGINPKVAILVWEICKYSTQ